MTSDVESGAVHLLHIGKTGGTSLKQVLSSNGVDRTADGRRIRTHFHGTKLVDVLAENKRNQAVFFLRDPVSRFVSGFNSRLRQGAPIAHIPWKPAETAVFTNFRTANDLAEALSARDDQQQDSAFVAMDALIHSRMHLTFWLRSPAYLDSRTARIVFVGLQEHYCDDVTSLLRLLVPDRDIPIEHLHKAPADGSLTLSEVAVANLRRWYADDIELYGWAVRRRGRWSAVPSGAVSE